VASQKPQAIFFDVDGVLIDSMRVKGQAFAAAFSDFPEWEGEIMTYHLLNGGVTRSEKIRRLFQLIVGRAPTDLELAARVDTFAGAVVQAVVDAPEVLGASQALSEWSGRAPLHAVSATPSLELRQIFEAREMSGFFSTVDGWPPTKAELMRVIIRENEYDPRACVLVGDSKEDLGAAQAVNMQFLGVGEFDTSSVRVSIPNLRELTPAIEALMADEST
jgi:phosphoglycolate phosphatase-like HAD superfamily hydrolase